MPESRKHNSSFIQASAAPSHPASTDGNTTARGIRSGRPPRAGSSFLARFGQLIVQHGIATIPSALFQYQGTLGLTAQEVWFISAVLSRKWTEDLPHPNLSKMERDTGVPERRLRRYKQRLCEGGFLNVYPRYDESGRQDSNYYDFGPLFEQIESLIAGEPLAPNPIRAEEGEDPEDSGLAIVRSAADAMPDHSFVARFGSVIVSRGVAAVPQALFTFEGDLGLTPQQMWFILYILSVPWAPPFPYPSLLKMATRTGYSKMQLHEIKNSLVSGGLLKLVRRTKEDGGQDSNGYDFAPLFEVLRKRLQGDTSGPNPPGTLTILADAIEEKEESTEPAKKARPARQGRAGAQKRAEITRSEPVTEAVNRLTGMAVNRLTEVEDKELTRVSDNKLTGVEVNRLTEETVNKLTEPVNPPSATSMSKGLRGRRSQGVHNKETSITEEQYKSVDSNQTSLNEFVREVRPNTASTPERFSPYIAAIVTDFSDELGDQGHTVSNVSQALKLYRESNLSETAFADLLFQARKTVRAYQGRQGLGTINNKMAYFFKVLRDLSRG